VRKTLSKGGQDMRTDRLWQRAQLALDLLLESMRATEDTNAAALDLVETARRCLNQAGDKS
jgi:hypothetical protein